MEIGKLIKIYTSENGTSQSFTGKLISVQVEYGLHIPLGKIEVMEFVSFKIEHLETKKERVIPFDIITGMTCFVNLVQP